MVKTYENRVFQSNSNSEMIVNPFLFSLFFLREMKYPLGKIEVSFRKKRDDCQFIFAVAEARMRKLHMRVQADSVIL